MIKTNLNYAIETKELEMYQEKVKSIHHMIHNKTGLGSDFLGWVEWPNSHDQNEITRMKKVASNLRQEIEVLVVIGIGGSYLGARAAIDMINGLYKKNQVQIIYVGNTISSTYTKQVLEYVKDKEFAICVISKSGTTTEPAIAFRLFQELLEQEKGKTIAKQRIIAVTDKAKGALKELANIEGYETFVIPDDIGGRYSVLTPVGLFAMLIANINIDNVFKGAKLAYQDTLTDELFNNQAYLYAAGRNILYKKGFVNEVLITYELQMQMITEWWKQLFGESEGKGNKAIFPASCVFSTDLHSLGQFIQEGSKVLFETVIKIETAQQDIILKANQSDLDGLNYLEGKSLHQINYLAFQAVLQAHKEEGSVPNIILTFNQMDDQMFGYLAYWFMKACAMSAYLLEINPFDQPGVEVYKKNMFKLLGK